MYLLDAPIVLALRRARDGGADPGLVAWASDVAPQSLVLSAITLHELEEGARRIMRNDRAAGFAWRAWLDDQVARAFEQRILPIDAAVVRRAAPLGYADPRDGLIAGTALEHGLTLVTLRRRAFRAGRVKLFDPTGYVAHVGDGDWRQATGATPAWIKNLFVRS
jgi:predicted nucleic acid-binding protein